MFSPSQNIGTVNLILPRDPDELLDVWLPVLQGTSKQPIGGELHCVLQFEPSSRSGVIISKTKPTINTLSPTNSNSVNVSNLSSPSTTTGNTGKLKNSIGSSSISAIHHTISAPPPLLTKSSINSTSSNSSHTPITTVGGSRMMKRVSSDFDGHAAALTINELMTGLENVKQVIEAQNDTKIVSPNSSSGGGSILVQSQTPERLGILRSARTELEEIRDQISKEETLSEEWRNKLVELSQAYMNDLTILMSTKAWENVNHQRASHRISQAGGAGPITNQLQNSLNRQHIEVTKEYYTMDNLELFDQLLDHGYAMQVTKPGDLDIENKIVTGSEIKLDYTAFIWDSANTLAVSFESSNDNNKSMEMQIGNEEYPAGLSLGLEGLCAGTEFLLCISPALAFGEDGTDKVPPNTHVLYEGKIISIKSPSPTLKRFESTLDPDNLIRNSRASMRFPARTNRVSVSINNGGDDKKSSQSLSLEKLAQTFAEQNNISTEKKNTVYAPPPLPPRSDYSRTLSKEPSAEAISTSSATLTRVPPPRPVNHSSQRTLDSQFSYDTVGSSVTSGKANSCASFDDWLEKAGLSSYSLAFQELGVEEIEDLQHVQKSDLENMGMCLIQIRKFISHIGKLGYSIDNS